MTSGTTLPHPAVVARDRGIKLPCTQHDPALWYPEGATEQAAASAARAVCMTCPLRETCRDYALGTPEPYGIWGGLTETNRHTLGKGRRPRDPIVRSLAPVQDIPTHLVPTARAMKILGLNSQQALSRLLRRYDVQPAERARPGGAVRASHLYDLADILRVKDQKKTYRRRASA